MVLGRDEAVGRTALARDVEVDDLALGTTATVSGSPSLVLAVPVLAGGLGDRGLTQSETRTAETGEGGNRTDLVVLHGVCCR